VNDDNARPSRHPSFLALDRHALGVAQPDVAAHVASCETCRARVAAPAPTAAVPAWARELPPRRRAWFLWPVSTRPRAFGLAAAALACAALVWVTGGKIGTPAGSHDYVGTKGGPELWLYVKRDDSVALWNGSDPVIPGDLLRLKIQPDRFKHVTVFGAARTATTTATAGGYSRLYDSAIASGEPTALPFSLKVDTQPGDESLLVVLGSAEVRPDQVDKLLAGDDEKSGRWWSRRLVLSKASTPRDGSRP
jgi:hypothetical protein